MDFLGETTIVALNVMGAVAFILTCVALLLLRFQNSNGWIVFLPSYLIQIIIFWETRQWFLLLQMIVLLLFSLLNYFKWEDLKNGSN